MPELISLPNAAALAELIQTGRDFWGVPGIGVGIVHGEEEYYVHGHGVKDITTGEPVTPDTLFGIASTTKAFTTTALAMLADEGKLDWDDPVRKHLPWFRLADPLASAGVTVRDLVTHRTGLSRNDMLWYKSPWSREEIVRKIGEVALAAPFRAKYQYNNIMYMAAGLVVGAVSGGTWEEFVQSRIFYPLGMTGANFRSVDAEAAPDHANPHIKNKEGVVTTCERLELDAEGPGGSINAGIRDLGRWMRMHLHEGVFQGERIVSAASLKETHTPQIVVRVESEADAQLLAQTETTQQTYAMGWSVWDYRGRKILSHGGAIDGFRSTVCLIPSLKLGIAILVNLAPTRMHEALRNSLFDLFFGLPPKDWNGFMREQDVRAEAEGEANKEKREAKRRQDTRPSHSLEEYAGKYRDVAYGTAKVTEEDGSLVLSWSSFRVVLEHWHYDTFFGRAPDSGMDARLTFGVNPDGEVESLKMMGVEFRRQP